MKTASRISSAIFNWIDGVSFVRRDFGVVGVGADRRRKEKCGKKSRRRFFSSSKESRNLCCPAGSFQRGKTVEMEGCKLKSNETDQSTGYVKEILKTDFPDLKTFQKYFWFVFWRQNSISLGIKDHWKEFVLKNNEEVIHERKMHSWNPRKITDTQEWTFIRGHEEIPVCHKINSSF